MRPRFALIDPGDTGGLDQYLRERQWRPHAYFAGLWNRDGGEYHSASKAAEIERDEQRQRDAIKAVRFNGSDDDMQRRETTDRRRHELDRVGPGRVPTIEYPKDGNWGTPFPKGEGGEQ